MNIGYCTTCTHQNCKTPNVRKKPDGNCSFWTNGQQIADINEHDTCNQCGEIIGIEAGNYPYACSHCNTEREAA